MADVEVSRIVYTLPPDNIRLVADHFGKRTGQPVLFVHGGGQTRGSWYECCHLIAQRGFFAVSLDLRGHGESDWCPEGDYTIERFAEDLLNVADTFDTPPILVGASLGGIAALVAEGEGSYSERRGFSGLVLVDIVPRVRDQGVKKILEFMSDRMDSGFASVEEAADSVARYLPHRPRPKDLSGLARNLRYSSGRYYWHWDPKFITGTSRGEGRPPESPERLEAAARNIKVPTLLVRGAKSELVDSESARQFADIVHHAEFIDIAGAGHMVSGDKNDAFTQAIMEYLLRVSGPDPSEFH